MESRDVMGLPSPSGASGVTPGSGSFGSLLQRTMNAAAAASSQTIMSSPPAVRSSSGPISSVALNSTNSSPPYRSEISDVIAPHHIQVDMTGMDTGMGTSGSETIKKKRGRPRKYGPDGSMALALSPLASPTTPMTSSQKKRGRPPGSGKNQQLAALGGWLASSAGVGFTPHVITVAAGEDVATKIMSFSQQGPRAVCILSANGAISNVTLRQPAASGGTVTYEGRFEILSLLGSFLPMDAGGTRSRTGGLSISLAGPDGRVLGGGIAGLLVAASPIQIVVGSFVYNDKKIQPRPAVPETPSGSAKEVVPLMAIPLVHTSIQENEAKPEKMNGFAAKLESPSLNPGTGATCDTPQSQFQTAGTQFHSVGWPTSQAMSESRHTNINITLPAG